MLGPTVFDRVLAGNTVGTLAMMLLAVLGFLTGRPEFLDLAIVYGLLNVIGTLAVLKFFRHGDLAPPRTTRRTHESGTLVDALSWLCLVAGGFFTVVGAIGLVRMPEVYTRMHAASVTDTLGAGLILLGLMLQAGFTLVAVKLLFLAIFIFFTSPVATHALVRAALASRREAAARAGGRAIEALIINVLLTLLAALTIAIAVQRNLFRR